MNIIELIDYIEEFFPGTFNTEDKRRRWELSFGDALTPGPELRTAIDAWLESVGPSRKKAPKVKDILKFWPSAPGKSGAGDGKTRLEKEVAAVNWGKAMIRGSHGHEAAIASPTFMNELFLWAKRHHDRFPSLDTMAYLADQGARFHANHAKIVDGKFPDGSSMSQIDDAPRMMRSVGQETRLVLTKTMAGMMATEGEAYRFHIANCDRCNLALLPEF